MSHPCDRFNCHEWNQGECFGGGCKANPMPEKDKEREEEQEESEEEDGE